MEERPSSDDSSQEVVGYPHSPPLSDAQSTRLNAWGNFQFIMCPNN